jgi:putative ABC transport system permease protein
MKTWIVRASLRLVPSEWRETLADELQETAEAEGRGAAWVMWQAGRAGLRLRTAMTFDSLWFDGLHAARSLMRAPWFTAGAVLTFALGIGINVAVFTAVDRVLFRTLPYERPDELVLMRETDAAGRPFGSIATPLMTAAAEHQGFLAMSTSGQTYGFFLSRDDTDAPPIRLTTVTHNMLEVFGVRVIGGRGFTADDAKQQKRLALISFDAWQRRFGAATDIVGRYLWSGGNGVEIVGVLPRSFIPPSSFLDPRSDGLVLDPSLSARGAGTRQLAPYVRLRPGVSVSAAQAQLDVLVDGAAGELPRGRDGQPLRLRLEPLRSVLFAFYVNYLWLIAGAASLVLAMACANLGSLMLVRNRSREHLAATHVALGAPAWRLMRSSLLECALLSLVGTVASLLVIAWSDATLRAILPPVFSRYSASVLDPRVLIFALVTAVWCTVVAGAYPSWRITRVDVLGVLQRGNTAFKPGRLRGSRSLLIVEAALSVMLVAGAAVTVRSFATLAMTDLGYSQADLYGAIVVPPRGSAPEAQYQQSLQALEVMKALPGVQSAGAVDVNPLSGAQPMHLMAPGLKDTARWQVTEGFFDALRLTVVAGRVITAEEVTRDAPVGVLSESGLRVALPDVRPDEAIGRTLRFPGERELEIVGIVRDLRASYAEPSTPSLYVPLSAKGFRMAMYVVRMAPGTVPVAADLRARLRQNNVAATTTALTPVANRLASALSDYKFRAVLFSGFGGAALLLAALGLYAIGAYDAARRRREIGVRLAIGSSSASVQWLMVRQALIPVLVGMAIGLAGAYWAATFVQSFLYQVDARDPWTLVSVCAVLLIATALAAWLPAYRASRLDPSTVLRIQ